MRTVTKKTIAGVSLLACVVVVLTGIMNLLPPVAVLKRAVLATGFFALAAFLGGLIYEKLWLR